MPDAYEGERMENIIEKGIMDSSGSILVADYVPHII